MTLHRKHFPPVEPASLDRCHPWWWQSYQRILARVYRSLIPSGARVLEIGCGEGGVLAILQPHRGVGVHISAEAVERARRKYPQLTFIQADIRTLQLKEAFDVIILSDVLNDSWDVQQILENLRYLATDDAQVLINTVHGFWRWAFSTAACGLSCPGNSTNWLSLNDLKNLFDLAGFKTVRCWHDVLFPLSPVLDSLSCRLVRFPPFSWLGMTSFIEARPGPAFDNEANPFGVSVIIPAQNEAGNIRSIFERMPRMGKNTELIFVEGGSSDGTAEEIMNQAAAHPEFHCVLLHQEDCGKWNAVRQGFAAAGEEILMILDADLTVAPEDLPHFYRVMVRGSTRFINGVRLVYPMEKNAMPFLNFIGNSIFSILFSWVCGQRVRDTLCGTKVLWKKDYAIMTGMPGHIDSYDSFGDFTLLFGAVRMGLQVIDLPVRYHRRTYGKTKIRRWKHGFQLLWMMFRAIFRLKFY